MDGKRESSDAIRVAAHEWRAQADSGDMSVVERTRFQAWLAADPRHRQAYERASRLWDEMSNLERSVVPDAAFRPLPRERLVSWWRAGWTAWPFRLAGGAVAAAIIVLLLFQVVPSGVFDPSGDRIETAVAEVRDVTLPDGSVMIVGARSSVSVALEPRLRRVVLHEGEVFFDVAPDPDRPFVVRSADARVEVVGTAFEIRRAEESVRVAVAEGLVEVAGLGRDAQDTTALLRQGQRVAVRGNGRLGPVEVVDPGKIAVWQRNRLVYIGAPLSEVVADANRYHDGWIVLRDREAAELKITGSFDARDIDAMFAALAEALPISVWRPIDAVTVIGSAASDTSH